MPHCGRVHCHRLALLDVIFHCKLPAIGDGEVRHNTVMRAQRICMRNAMVLLSVLLRDVARFDPLCKTNLALFVAVETANSRTSRAEHDHVIVQSPGR